MEIIWNVETPCFSMGSVKSYFPAADKPLSKTLFPSPDVHLWLPLYPCSCAVMPEGSRIHLMLSQQEYIYRCKTSWGSSGVFKKKPFSPLCKQLQSGNKRVIFLFFKTSFDTSDWLFLAGAGVCKQLLTYSSYLLSCISPICILLNSAVLNSEAVISNDENELPFPPTWIAVIYYLYAYYTHEFRLTNPKNTVLWI